MWGGRWGRSAAYSDVPKKSSQSAPEMNEKTSSSRSTLESTSVKRSDAIISFHARAQHCHSAERASTDQSAAPEAAAAAAAASESPLLVPSSLTLKWCTASG